MSDDDDLAAYRAGELAASQRPTTDELWRIYLGPDSTLASVQRRLRVHRAVVVGEALLLLILSGLLLARG